MRLQVFRTKEGKGWGVRATERIPAETLVGVYAGEYFRLAEADVINETNDAAGKCMFSMGLGKNDNFCIDSTNVRNATTFINHACTGGNVRTLTAKGGDSRLPFNMFETTAVVEKGEELTFDYFKGQEDQVMEGVCGECSEKKGVEVRHCLCGACRAKPSCSWKP